VTYETLESGSVSTVDWVVRGTRVSQEPTCQQGTVVEDHGVDLDVRFDTNPWGDSGGPTEVAVLSDQVVAADPDRFELEQWASNLSEFGDE